MHLQLDQVVGPPPVRPQSATELTFEDAFSALHLSSDSSTASPFGSTPSSIENGPEVPRGRTLVRSPHGVGSNRVRRKKGGKKLKSHEAPRARLGKNQVTKNGIFYTQGRSDMPSVILWRRFLRPGRQSTIATNLQETSRSLAEE